MATNNPLRQPLNRANQLPNEDKFSRRGISLYDVDSAIFNYMNDIVVPNLKVDNAEINVPVIYGNAERWKSAQIDGVYRDKRGKIQLPLIMFKRTTVERNDTIPMLNRFLHYPSYQRYSKKNVNGLYWMRIRLGMILTIIFSNHVLICIQKILSTKDWMLIKVSMIHGIKQSR